MTRKLVVGTLLLAAAFGANIAWAAPTVGPVPGTSNSVRFAGLNRYETAIAVSQGAGWDATNTLIVFLATGDNFPDALALGASTGLTGPILLVSRDTVPAGVADEVQRLAPCVLVVSGGTGAVSDAVVQQLDSLANPADPKCSAPAPAHYRTMTHG